MPNIVIVGFPQKDANRIREQVDVIMQSHDSEAVTSVINSMNVDVRFCHNGLSAPYLIVRDSDARQAKEIAEDLNKTLNLNVEWEVIGGFLEKKIKK